MQHVWSYFWLDLYRVPAIKFSLGMLLKKVTFFDRCDKFLKKLLDILKICGKNWLWCKYNKCYNKKHQDLFPTRFFLCLYIALSLKKEGLICIRKDANDFWWKFGINWVLKKDIRKINFIEEERQKVLSFDRLNLYFRSK